MRFLGAHIALVLVAWLTGVAPVSAQSERTPCDNEIQSIGSDFEGLPQRIATHVGRSVRNAPALFRFHRVDEALAKLDGVIAVLEGPEGQRLPSQSRTDLLKSTRALRSCLATAQPPGLATITIRPFLYEENVAEKDYKPALVGAYVDVDGIRLGRTGPDGALRAKAPSGPIRIEGTQYPSSWGEQEMTLAPGASQTVSIPLDDGKEPAEDSDLVLEEAPDDILPNNSGSLTLKFLQDEGPVTLKTIETVELEDSPDRMVENLASLFIVRNGALRAAHPAAVFELIAKHSKIGRPLRFHAAALDTEGRVHDGAVSVEIGRSSLAVTLAPPPSNPDLPVSNISVRMSVMGFGVALSRVSDAQGRFQIDALPDAVIAFDSTTIVDGVYYYGQATTTLCGDRAVTLVMRHVKDVVKGIPALTVDSSSPPCPPVPGR